MKTYRLPLLLLLWFFIVLMGIGVVLFLMHKDKPFTDWTTDYWAFIISIFSALFSGLNVLAFYHLTIAVESKNSEREEKSLRIDGLKYQLEQQHMLFDSIYAIHQIFSTEKRISKLAEISDYSALEQELFTIQNEYEMLRVLKSCDTLFPSVNADCVTKLMNIYAEFQKKNEQEQYNILATDDNVEDLTKEYCSSLSKYWKQNISKINANMSLLIAQMRYDMQVALAQSIGQQPPEKPDWTVEWGLIYVIENREKMMDATRGIIKELPTTATVYSWDISYFMQE